MDCKSLGSNFTEVKCFIHGPDMPVLKFTSTFLSLEPSMCSILILMFIKTKILNFNISSVNSSYTCPN